MRCCRKVVVARRAVDRQLGSRCVGGLVIVSAATFYIHSLMMMASSKNVFSKLNAVSMDG